MLFFEIFQYLVSNFFPSLSTFYYICIIFQICYSILAVYKAYIFWELQYVLGGRWFAESFQYHGVCWEVKDLVGMSLQAVFLHPLPSSPYITRHHGILEWSIIIYSSWLGGGESTVKLLILNSDHSDTYITKTNHTNIHIFCMHIDVPINVGGWTGSMYKKSIYS